MRRVQARFFAVGLILALALVASACANDNEEPSGAGGQTTASTSPTKSQSASGDSFTVEEADSDLGDILTDDEGYTLYAFDQDTNGTSTCTGDCASTWPAFTSEGDPTAGPGLDESLLGTTGGGMETQVTYNDHPLYHYVGDVQPGQTNGQGIGDVWHVVGPDGDPITKAADNGGGGGGYGTGGGSGGGAYG
jgi:predicted lipoprotein with Yx(FWY)xxD motif